MKDSKLTNYIYHTKYAMNTTNLQLWDSMADYYKTDYSNTANVKYVKPFNCAIELSVGDSTRIDVVKSVVDINTEDPDYTILKKDNGDEVYYSVESVIKIYKTTDPNLKGINADIPPV